MVKNKEYTAKCGCKFTNMRYRKGEIKGWSKEYCDRCWKITEKINNLQLEVDLAEMEMRTYVK